MFNRNHKLILFGWHLVRYKACPPINSSVKGFEKIGFQPYLHLPPVFFPGGFFFFLCLIFLVWGMLCLPQAALFEFGECGLVRMSALEIPPYYMKTRTAAWSAPFPSSSVGVSPFYQNFSVGRRFPSARQRERPSSFIRARTSSLGATRRGTVSVQFFL
jgi:hypothetical protein